MTSTFHTFLTFLTRVTVVLIMTVGVMTTLCRETLLAQLEDRRKDADAVRINDATAALTDIMSMEDTGIPRAILEKAQGVAIFPRMPRMASRRGQGPNTRRTQRMLGITGRGILSVRGETGTWSTPAFIALTGSSLPQTADLVLVIMNRSGVDKLTGYEFAIDEGAPVAPGPVGGDARGATDGAQQAEIFVYSRSRGELTGASLTGSKVQGDTIANQRFYGKALSTRNAVAQASGPEPVAAWRAALEKYAK